MPMKVKACGAFTITVTQKARGASRTPQALKAHEASRISVTFKACENSRIPLKACGKPYNAPGVKMPRDAQVV